jgi:hypothetical protein
MRVMTLKDYSRTSDYEPTIQSQTVFCTDGLLWQGFKGGPMPVNESQLMLEELKNIPDKDGTMYKVWFRIAQRLESRTIRKVEEYGKRRQSLRIERGQIRDSVKHDHEMGIDPSPGDLQDIKRIDDRMERLADPGLEDDYLYAKAHSVPGGEVDVHAEPEATPELQACPQCGDACPPGKVFKKWINGHNVGKHRQRKAS